MNYTLETRSVPVVFLDGWLVRLERRAFGWDFRGSHTEKSQYETTERKHDTVDIDGTSHDVSYNQRVIKTKITQYYDFVRVSPYSFNFFFGLLGIISGVFSTIRRWVMYLVDILLALLLGLSILTLILGSSEIGSIITDVIFPLLLAYGIFIVLPSLLLAGLALLLRKVFDVDRKLQADLIMNGLNPNWKQWF